MSVQLTDVQNKFISIDDGDQLSENEIFGAGKKGRILSVMASPQFSVLVGTEGRWGYRLLDGSGGPVIFEVDFYYVSPVGARPVPAWNFPDVGILFEDGLYVNPAGTGAGIRSISVCYQGMG